MRDERPQISQIITTDYAAFVGALNVSFGVLLWAANYFFGLGGRDFREGDPPVMWTGLTMFVLGLLLLTWRLSSFRSFFTNGHRVPGTITTVWFLRGRGRIEYEYEYGGARRRASHAVYRTRRTMAMQTHMPVTVLVDPTNPKRTILFDLYV